MGLSGNRRYKMFWDACWPFILIYGIGKALEEDPYATVAHMLATLYTLLVLFVSMVFGIFLTAVTTPTSSMWIQQTWSPILIDALSPVTWWTDKIQKYDMLIFALGIPIGFLGAVIKGIFILPVKGGNWQLYLAYTIGILISLRVWIGMIATTNLYRRANAKQQKQMDRFYNPLRDLRRGNWN
jgi:hypothetical protein